VAGRNVEFSVVDLERLYRASREAITRDRIEIDFLSERRSARSGNL
jgi:hypothetical protein